MTPQARLDRPTNVDVVTYAVAELQGGDKPVHLERIAVKAHAHRGVRAEAPR